MVPSGAFINSKSCSTVQAIRTLGHKTVDSAYFFDGSVDYMDFGPK